MPTPLPPNSLSSAEHGWSPPTQNFPRWAKRCRCIPSRVTRDKLTKFHRASTVVRPKPTEPQLTTKSHPLSRRNKWGGEETTAETNPGTYHPALIFHLA